MDAQEAARTLWSRYRGASWFAGVGISSEGGPESLVLYVSRSPGSEISALSQWQGFPLVIVVSGEPIAFRGKIALTKQSISAH